MAYELIACDGNMLLLLEDKFKKDKEICKHAIKNTTKAFEQMDKSLLKNVEFAKEIIEINFLSIIGYNNICFDQIVFNSISFVKHILDTWNEKEEIYSTYKPYNLMELLKEKVNNEILQSKDIAELFLKYMFPLNTIDAKLIKEPWFIKLAIDYKYDPNHVITISNSQNDKDIIMYVINTCKIDDE